MTIEAAFAALQKENEELREARDFWEERAMIEERCQRELREAIRAAGFSTQYFDKLLHCFPNSVDECKLRDRVAETVYQMARHFRDFPADGEPINDWIDKSRRLLQKLRAIDFTRFQKEMDRV